MRGRGWRGHHVGNRRMGILTLPAGHYELVWKLRNQYANGMYQELGVN